MKHNIDFFRDEIRNGFYIPTAVKQSWACALDVLSEIDRICKKHDITYFADWGTFLGAVRHGGFVPWDDDLDICMKRDDYTKFRQVADHELPPDFCIHDYERHEGHWLFLSRVVSSTRINFDESYLNSHYNFPWLTGVDIFLKDYLYKDSAQEKERCDEIMFILAVAESVITGTANATALNDNLDKLEKKYSYRFIDRSDSHDLAVSLYRLAEKQMARISKEQSDRLCQIFPWGLKGSPGEPKEYYESAEYLPFEDTFIPVPSHYNKVLSSRYGEYNYIKKGVAGHDYPSFEGQRKNFERSTGMTLPRFTFDASLLYIDRGFSFDSNTVSANTADNSTGNPSSNVSNHHKRKVLFLPIGPAEWKGLEATYNREMSDPNTEVAVVPLPLMPKNCLGQVSLSDDAIDVCVHLSEYPEGLPIISWEDYDLEQQIPDTVYIQSPYDAENPYLTIPPYYYAENLIFYTKELVYIPIGPVADFTEEDIPDQKVMDFYVTMPAVILADRIYLHSESLRTHYISKLTSFSGDESTRSIWEKRICVIPDLYPLETHQSSIKKLLYCISTYEYAEHAENFEEAIKNRIAILKENSEKIEVSICLYPNPDIQNISGGSSDFMYEESLTSGFYNRVLALANAEGFEIVSFDKKDIDGFVSCFDAYYGSSCPLVPVFVAQKKPVMIANYELDL